MDRDSAGQIPINKKNTKRSHRKMVNVLPGIYNICSILEDTCRIYWLLHPAPSIYQYFQNIPASHDYYSTVHVCMTYGVKYRPVHTWRIRDSWKGYVHAATWLARPWNKGWAKLKTLEHCTKKMASTRRNKLSFVNFSLVDASSTSLLHRSFEQFMNDNRDW